MSFSLYNAVIPTYQQILPAVAGLLDKAEAYCAETNTSPESIIQATLADDMKPFAFQISSVAWHSMTALDGVRKGVFSPDFTEPPTDFAGLRNRITAAQQAVDAVLEKEVNDFVGQPMRFEMGDYKMNFVAEDFLLTFSQPNFYFHAVTAYDILRAKGLPIGKMDFMGQMRLQA